MTRLRGRSPFGAAKARASAPFFSTAKTWMGRDKPGHDDAENSARNVRYRKCDSSVPRGNVTHHAVDRDSRLIDSGFDTFAGVAE
jgi:hypothetical protein